MRELILALSNTTENEYAFLRYLLNHCDRNGQHIFDGPCSILHEHEETPDYFIRHIGSHILKHPLSFCTEQRKILIRALAYQSRNTTEPYKVSLSDFILKHRTEILAFMEDGTLPNLRKLKLVSSKLLYFNFCGEMEITEDEAKRLLDAHESVRFDNYVARRLKPSLAELEAVLGLATSYSVTKVNKRRMIYLKVHQV